MDLEYRHVGVGGREIALLDAGTGSPVLLLHGFTLNARSFRHQWKPLVEAGFRPIAPDNPGFGRTPLPREFSGRAEDYADLHDALLASLGIEGPVPVVGHSLGGGMALFLCLRHPHRVSSIVAISPASEPSHSALRVARVARQDRFNEVAPHFFTRERLGQIVRSAYGPNPPAPEVVEDYVSAISVVDAFSVVTTFFSDAFLQLRERYSEIEVPVLIVAGQEDPHNPMALSERPAREIPNSSLSILPGLAHCPHEEGAPSFNKLLLAFLKTARSAPRSK
jgi:pimeloyl-ACP methyl ester carboxylesterase